MMNVPLPFPCKSFCVGICKCIVIKHFCLCDVIDDHGSWFHFILAKYESSDGTFQYCSVIFDESGKLVESFHSHKSKVYEHFYNVVAPFVNINSKS